MTKMSVINNKKPSKMESESKEAELLYNMYSPK